MKYFIDCGTHFFQGLNTFNEIYNFDKDWEIYSFEANPLTYDKSKEYYPKYENLYHINKAIWTNEEGINLNIDSTEELTQGSNILQNPPHVDITWGTRYSWDKKIYVETIDLSKFLKEIKDKDPECYIIIKMDIEGAEFDVLEKLIKEESYIFVNRFYVEFHERFFINCIEQYKTKKYDIISFLKNKNITIEEWI